MVQANILRRSPFASVLNDLPIRLLDVGSRGGIDPSLLPIAFAVDATGFEPAADECARLNGLPADPWRSARHFAAAIGPATGPARLHVTESPVSSTLMVPDAGIGRRFGKTFFSTVVEEVEIEAVGLDDAIERFALPPQDVLKLDIEGPELDCLRAAPRTMSSAVAIRTETAFLPLRVDQPLMRHMDDFLARNGFELLDIADPAHWRRHGHHIHPFVGCEPIPYSRGQIVQADLIYMREPAALAAGADFERIVRAALVAMAWGYFDRAEEYLGIADTASRLRRDFGIEAGPALRSASSAYGRAAWQSAVISRIRGVFSLIRQRAALPQRKPPARPAG